MTQIATSLAQYIPSLPEWIKKAAKQSKPKMLHIIIKIYVFLRRKTENIFVFIAPFLCVISLSCWFQVDLGETRSLLRTSLTIMWLKVYLLKLTCQVCMFYIIQQCLICSSYSSPKCGDENTRISLWKNTLFLCFFFFASVSIRSFQKIYFSISSSVFWCKCCYFSADLR